eukprot:SAG22_NODE_495_length_9802_cov_111.077605_5_plen_88_part_00
MVATSLLAGGVGLAALAILLRVHPAVVDSPHTHVSQETRQVQIGAMDPVTKHHMILTMSLDESYPTDMAKEFLRVLQVNAPHLTGDM